MENKFDINTKDLDKALIEKESEVSQDIYDVSFDPVRDIKITDLDKAPIFL